jgi:hypothetical protein
MKRAWVVVAALVGCGPAVEERAPVTPKEGFVCPSPTSKNDERTFVQRTLSQDHEFAVIRSHLGCLAAARFALFDVGARTSIVRAEPRPSRVWFWPEAPADGAYLEFRTVIGDRVQTSLASIDFARGVRFVRRDQAEIIDLVAAEGGLLVRTPGALMSIDPSTGLVLATRALASDRETYSLGARPAGALVRDPAGIAELRFSDLGERCRISLPSVEAHRALPLAGRRFAIVRGAGVEARAGDVTSVIDLERCVIEKTVVGSVVGATSTAIFTQLDRSESTADLGVVAGDYLVRTDLRTMESRAIALPVVGRPRVIVAADDRHALAIDPSGRAAVVDLATGTSTALARPNGPFELALKGPAVPSKDGSAFFAIAAFRGISGTAPEEQLLLVRVAVEGARPTVAVLSDPREAVTRLFRSPRGEIVLVRASSIELYDPSTLELSSRTEE